MIKSNLPVILLKNLVLLTHQEVRIEIKSDISKKVTEISKLYHDGEVLIVCPLNSLEESPDTSDLPRVGVVGKIKSVIDLPNGNMRCIISGLYRVKVISYVNYSNEEEVSIFQSLNDIDNIFEKFFVVIDKYFIRIMADTIKPVIMPMADKLSWIGK